VPPAVIYSAYQRHVSAVAQQESAERRCDPQFLDLLVERMTIWNRPLAYLLSGVTVFALGFFAATGV